MPEYSQEQIDRVCRKLLGDYPGGDPLRAEPPLVIQVVEYPQQEIIEPWVLHSAAACALVVWAIWEALRSLH